MEVEIISADHPDHARCLSCHRPLKNPKWRKLGRGKKCYAKHCQNCQQTLEDLGGREKMGLPASSTVKEITPPADADSFHSHNTLLINSAMPENQERAPDLKIQKADRRSALERVIQEEMARKDPAPTEAQMRAAEQRLMSDVDKALGLEEEEDGGESDPGEPTGQAGAAEETGQNRKKKNVGKIPKGQAIVRPAAFNRSGRSMIVSGRNNRA